jgi:undecaprenyl-diphosphatase
MVEWLENIDTQLLLLINGSHCTFCDFIFYWASDRIIWIPFYLFLAFVLYRRFGIEMWKILLSVTALIFLSDQISVLIKDIVMRYRPCHNLLLQSQIHLVNGKCGGQFGFVSSHAANSFALASFLILLASQKIKWLTVLLLSWCLLVSYSRVYLGTHYPSDIVGGWILGFALAALAFNFYKKLLKKYE